MKNSWRAPNPHEKEIISEWVRTIGMNEAPVVRTLTFCFAIFAVCAVFYALIKGSNAKDTASIYFLSIVNLTFLLCVSLHESHRHKQILDGDYQIQDAVVAGSRIRHGYRGSTHYSVHAKKSSGEIVYVGVSWTIYGVARKHSHGYLLSYGNKAPGKYVPIHAFFPAAPPDSFI